MLSALRRCWNWVKTNWNWLRWPVTILILGLLFYRHRSAFDQLRDQPVNWGLLLLAASMSAASLLLTQLRWYLLVASHEIPFRFWEASRLSFLGYLCNYVAPGGGGGDLVKAVLIARSHPTRKTTVISSIALDRILGMVALLLTAAIATVVAATALVSQPEFQPIRVSYLTGAALGLAGVILLMVPLITGSRWLQRMRGFRFVGNLISQLLDDVESYQRQLWILPFCIVISVFGHFLMLSMFCVVGLALFSPPEIPTVWEHLQFMGAAQLVGVVVPLPGGIGGLEEATAWFYKLCGKDAATGFLMIIVFRVMLLCVAAIGASSYLTHRKAVIEALHEAEEQTSEPITPEEALAPRSSPCYPP